MPGLFLFWSTTMSDEVLKIVLNKVEKIEQKISNAKSMNGGFDKLMVEVTHIKEVQDGLYNSDLSETELWASHFNKEDIC